MVYHHQGVQFTKIKTNAKWYYIVTICGESYLFDHKIKLKIIRNNWTVPIMQLFPTLKKQYTPCESTDFYPQ
jgi:hypothetical protein